MCRVLTLCTAGTRISIKRVVWCGVVSHGAKCHTSRWDAWDAWKEILSKFQSFAFNWVSSFVENKRVINVLFYFIRSPHGKVLFLLYFDKAATRVALYIKLY